MASSCPGRGIGGWQWADMPLAMMMMMMMMDLTSLSFSDNRMNVVT